MFKLYSRYGDVIQQYEVLVSLSRMVNDILTLDQQWIPNKSDFPPAVWPWYRASTIYEWFPLSIWNGCDVPAGNAYPSGHLVPSPFLGLACAPIFETTFLELTMSLLDFSPWIALGTLILLKHNAIDTFKYVSLSLIQHAFVSDEFCMNIKYLHACKLRENIMNPTKSEHPIGRK